MSELSKPRVAIMAVGAVLFILLGVFGITTLLQVWHETTHRGIIVEKFIAVNGGTTEYHLLVNESGSIKDVQTDSVGYYTGTQIGSVFSWTTRPLEEYPSEIFHGFLAITVALIGGTIFLGVMALNLDREDHGPS